MPEARGIEGTKTSASGLMKALFPQTKDTRDQNQEDRLKLRGRAINQEECLLSLALDLAGLAVIQLLIGIEGSSYVHNRVTKIQDTWQPTSHSEVLPFSCTILACLWVLS